MQIEETINKIKKDIRRSVIKGGLPTELKSMAVEREILDKELMEERKRNNKVDEIMNGEHAEVDIDKRLEELREFAKTRKLKL